MEIMHARRTHSTNQTQCSTGRVCIRAVTTEFQLRAKKAAFPQWQNCAVATRECRKIVRYVAPSCIKCICRVVRKTTPRCTREHGRKCQHAIPLLDNKLLFIAWKHRSGNSNSHFDRKMQTGDIVSLNL